MITEYIQNTKHFNDIRYTFQHKTIILEFDGKFEDSNLKVALPLFLVIPYQTIYTMKDFVKIKNSSVRHLLKYLEKLLIISPFDNLSKVLY